MDKRGRRNTDHHVHFDSAAVESEEKSDIVLKRLSDNVIEINLGFLQLNHKYSIHFSVSRELLKIEENNDLIYLDDSKVPKTNIQINSIDHNKELIKIEMEYLAKDKISDQVLKFQLSNNDKIFSFVFISRVLGIGKGTPLLKDGIRCIGVTDSDDDSETSDFPENDD